MTIQVGTQTIAGSPEEILFLKDEIEYGHIHKDTRCDECEIGCDGRGFCVLELEPDLMAEVDTQ